MTKVTFLGECYNIWWQMLRVLLAETVNITFFSGRDYTFDCVTVFDFLAM